jgi:hypothetical protein
VTDAVLKARNCGISGSHSNDCGEYYLLGCDTVEASRSSPTFHGKVLAASCLLLASFLGGSLFDCEDEAVKLLRNAGELLFGTLQGTALCEVMHTKPLTLPIHVSVPKLFYPSSYLLY